MPASNASSSSRERRAKALRTATGATRAQSDDHRRDGQRDLHTGPTDIALLHATSGVSLVAASGRVGASGSDEARANACTARLPTSAASLASATASTRGPSDDVHWHAAACSGARRRPPQCPPRSNLPAGADLEPVSGGGGGADSAESLSPKREPSESAPRGREQTAGRGSGQFHVPHAQMTGPWQVTSWLARTASEAIAAAWWPSAWARTPRNAASK